MRSVKIIAVFCIIAVFPLFSCGTRQGGQAESERTTEETVGLYPILQDGKWGYIDKSGKIVIELQYEWAGAFSEGLARIKINEQHGFIDKTGKIVIKPQFDMADSFSGGLSAVSVGNKLGYIDKTGKFVWETPQ